MKPVDRSEKPASRRPFASAFGGMSLDELASISRHSEGMAVVPIFGRPRPLPADQQIDVFVLMPFKAKLEAVYSKHMKKMAEEFGLRMLRADEIFSPSPSWKKCGTASAPRNSSSPTARRRTRTSSTRSASPTPSARRCCSSRVPTKIFRPTSSISTTSTTTTILKASRSLIGKLKSIPPGTFHARGLTNAYDKVTASFNEPAANGEVVEDHPMFGCCHRTAGRTESVAGR